MIRATHRVLIAVLSMVVIAPVLINTPAAGGPPHPAEHRAGVVVQHSNLGTLTDCVKFHEKKLDGIRLLQRSRFEYRGAKFTEGTGVCWLDGEGCKTTDPDDCFCTPASGVTASWSYWTQEKHDEPLVHHGETYPSGRSIEDGSVDYWTFGPHGMPPAELLGIDQICGS